MPFYDLLGRNNTFSFLNLSRACLSTLACFSIIASKSCDLSGGRIGHETWLYLMRKLPPV